ncbi:DNA double-strand break repair nuclease NurA [Vibrio rhodolitus]|uniref:DNA double-strand break repair nuclease NurA n=1 Tax=Vibrio rhodolitus TaxID=2231649 RepID=UPI000E0B3637|nr:DNA double-strand break repair nuclease NurA [Vibrio rhodolitus]
MDPIESRINELDFSGRFLEALIHQTQNETGMDFLDILTRTSKVLRQCLLEADMIKTVKVSSAEFWKGQRGKKLSFIDGGVSSVQLPVANLIGIRAGSYTVELGKSLEDKEREKFDIKGCIVDDLFNSELMEDDFDDTSTLTDAARMLVEILATESVVLNDPTINAVFVHGPLINPAAPYGRQGTSYTPGFPNFSKDGQDQFSDISIGFKNSDDSDKKHFISAYRAVLERLYQSKTLVAGVVERPAKRSVAVVNTLLDNLHKNGLLSKTARAEFKTRIDFLQQHKMGDALIFSVVLAPGEYIMPFRVERQGGRGKWPQKWAGNIERIPNPMVAFLRTSAESDVVRLECFESSTTEEQIYLCELTMKMSQLLPKYSFPVGLDIVDKEAKVPRWLTKGIESQYGIAMLREALKSKNPDDIHYAKRILLANGRDWLFRPKAGI